MGKAPRDTRAPKTGDASRDGMPSPPGRSLRATEALIEALSADVMQTLEAIRVAAFIVDHERRVRWQNAAATELVGDLRGRLDRTFVAPEDLVRVREAFARKQMGALHTDYEATLMRPDGARVRLAVSSVPLKGADQSMIGSFAIARPVASPEPPSTKQSPQLTPRQRQTLTLLAAGCSTPQMAR